MPYKNDLENTSIVALANKSNIIMQALHEVESHYKQGALAYEEQLKSYTLQIAQYKHQIKQKILDNKKQEKILFDIESLMMQDERLLVRLNTEFSNIIQSLSELRYEYKDIVSPEEYEKLLSTKESSLVHVLDEIEDIETVLLDRELEHLNIKAIVEPLRKEIEELEHKIETLNLEKEYYATTQLHKISQLSLHLNDKNENHEILEANIISEDEINK